MSRGVEQDAARLPALVCAAAAQLLGSATYAIDGEECELVSLEVSCPDKGAGSALLRTVADAARASGWRRLVVIPTGANDNRRALRCYQRLRRASPRCARAQVDEARRSIKPAIPETGEDAMPVHNELELTLELA